MKAILFLLAALVATVGIAGCGGTNAREQQAKRETETTRTPTKEDRIQASLAKLDAKDRPLAEAQKFCAVETHSRLGSMGAPAKILVRGQPVFLCCEGCEKQARADEEKTLRQVADLKAAHAKSNEK